MKKKYKARPMPRHYSIWTKENKEEQKEFDNWCKEKVAHAKQTEAVFSKAIKEINKQYITHIIKKPEYTYERTNLSQAQMNAIVEEFKNLHEDIRNALEEYIQDGWTHSSFCVGIER